MPDMLINAGDGTQRVIESDAIRALVGYVEQRDGLGDWPSLDEEEAESERAEQRQRDAQSG